MLRPRIPGQGCTGEAVDRRRSHNPRQHEAKTRSRMHRRKRTPANHLPSATRTVPPSPMRMDAVSRVAPDTSCPDKAMRHPSRARPTRRSKCPCHTSRARNRPSPTSRPARRGRSAQRQRVICAKRCQRGGQPPIMPFNLAISPSLPTPTLWPAVALRVDAAADGAVPVAGLAVESFRARRTGSGASTFASTRRARPHRCPARRRAGRQGHLAPRGRTDRDARPVAPRRTAARARAAARRVEYRGRPAILAARPELRRPRQEQRGSANIAQLIVPEDETAAAEAARRGYGRLIGLGGGVDIKV